MLALASVLAACAVADDDAGTNEEAATRIPPFRESTATALPTQACGPGADRGCYTNYAITTDLDGDGNLDLVTANGGGHFVVGRPEPQAIYFGDGKGAFAQDPAAFPSGIKPSIVRQVAVGDFDGDGRLDVYFPGGFGTTPDQLFLQTAPRRFEDASARALGGLRSRAGAVHAGDIDGDGDLDLLVADWGAQPNPDSPGTPASAVTIRLYVNDGTGTFSTGATLPAPEGSSATDIDVADVDGDFDLDLVLTNRNGQSRLYLNDGAGLFTDVTRVNAFPKKRGPYGFNAELCDVDADGDLDLLFDGAARSLAGHSTQLLVNDGTGHYTDETELRIAAEPRSDDNQVKCGDVDNDGDFDLVVASLSNPSEKLLRNDGTGHFRLVDGVFPRLGDPTLAIDLGDFDGDGKVDLLTAQGEVPGQTWLERIFLNGGALADVRPPVFRRVEQPIALEGAPVVVRVAVSDAHTSETGQEVRQVGFELVLRDAAAREQRVTVPARFVGGDLFRAVLPALPAGTSATVTPRAIDRAGNEALGPAFTLSPLRSEAPPRR